MSWAEFLSHLLQTSRKVDKAAVFNIRGQPLATTEDLQVTVAEGLALLHCLKDPAQTITRINIDNSDYRCFQGINNNLVGVCTSAPGRVLVARMTEEALVVVMGVSEGHGSFIFELQQNLEERTRRHLVPQLSPPVPTTGTPGDKPTFHAAIFPAATDHEQVLVQLNDSQGVEQEKKVVIHKVLSKKKSSDSQGIEQEKK